MKNLHLGIIFLGIFVLPVTSFGAPIILRIYKDNLYADATPFRKQVYNEDGLSLDGDTTNFFGHEILEIESIPEEYDPWKQLFVGNGANLEKQDDKYGSSPLMGAAANGHYAIVELLLQRGANTALRAKNGYTALDFAKMKGQTKVAALLEKNLIRK